MKYVQLSDSATMAYQSIGDGPPLVLVHAPGIGSANFSCQMPLSHSHRLLIPDLRGHGESSPAREPFTLRTIAADIHAMLDAEKVEQASICGYSQGGSIALECLLAYPDRFHAAILVSSFSEVNDLYLHARFFLAEALTSMHGVKWLAHSTARSHLDDPDEQKRWIAHAEKTDGFSLHQMYLAGHHYTCTDQLPTIKIPVMLVYGEEDRAMLPYAQLLQHKLPHAQLHLVPGVKHQVITKAPSAFHQLCDSFLTSSVALRT
ncbi:alpha/beta fold hydrolase [Brevibacillus migulae]|uniref:alpha/beta fold hydrolase n=1 Tax=Brevibacillus migulae TaxID=1644114 RepID=UPI00106E6434|nr:alpha/beta hydrolase [Brevibacillus migulae]